MKIVCVYHNQDLDGKMSAAIVKMWNRRRNKSIGKNHLFLDDDLDFIGYNYGDSIPDLLDYDMVIMCDISFPPEHMSNLFERLGESNLLWCDHHKSAIIDSETHSYNKCGGIRDIKYSACELTYMFFFAHDAVPKIVEYLGKYDTFRHIGTDEQSDVVEFQYGARSFITDYEQAFNWLNPAHQRSNVDAILNAGSQIYAYLCIEAVDVYKTRFSIRLDQLNSHYSNSPNKSQLCDNTWNFVCINREDFNPYNFGIDYRLDGYDGAACFHMRSDGRWKVSLRSIGDIDCSIIARQYGGGGHVSAASFILDKKQFNEIILK